MKHVGKAKSFTNQCLHKPGSASMAVLLHFGIHNNNEMGEFWKKPKYFWIFFFREAPHILRIPKHHPVFCLIPGISFFPPFSYENVHGVNQFSYKLFTLCYGISSNTRKNVIFFYTITQCKNNVTELFILWIGPKDKNKMKSDR